MTDKKDWFEDNTNVAALYRWLRARREEPGPDDVAYFIGKPWKWTPEWERMQAEAQVELTEPILP